jgi:hypothetical protein
MSGDWTIAKVSKSGEMSFLPTDEGDFTRIVSLIQTFDLLPARSVCAVMRRETDKPDGFQVVALTHAKALLKPT